MAHGPEVKERVRAAYVYKRLSLKLAASINGVSLPAAQAWKTRAKERGDDWDLVRASASLSSEGQDEMAMTLLNDFITLFKSTQEMVNDDEGLTAMEKVQAVGSLSDNFAKSMKCFQRLLPDINTAVVAQTTVNLLAEFIACEFPEHLEAFCDILEPFARRLADNVKDAD